MSGCVFDSGSSGEQPASDWIASSVGSPTSIATTTLSPSTSEPAEKASAGAAPSTVPVDDGVAVVTSAVANAGSGATILVDDTADDSAFGGTPTDADAARSETDAEAPAGAPDSLGEAAYPILADGSPAPVLTIFDVETVTLQGAVPSEESRDYLAGLALANSKFPDAELVDELAINPRVPLDVGVRVVELNSVRFPTNSDDVLPNHAAELDRAVAIMDLFPHVSVLVIGHADQRGSAEANYRISGERAYAVVEYMVSKGVDPARLSSRAVGADDLIVLGNDEAAFALNRRTEFVFYGLLI